MDWIDPKYASKAGKSSKKPSKSSRTNEDSKTTQSSTSASTKGPAKSQLKGQVAAALAQPLEVWSSAYDHELSKLKWAKDCSAEGSLLWSTTSLPQAEVLVRGGMSAKKLAAIVSNKPTGNKEDQAKQISDVVGLMDHSLENLAFSWLETADVDPLAALGTLAIAWHLPEHARRPGNDWLPQWLKRVVEDLTSIQVDPEAGILPSLAFHCELPLLIAYATAASSSTLEAEASRAMDNLAEYLESCEENIEHWLAHRGSFLRPALACIFRCRTLANSLRLRKWYPPQQKALAKLLIDAARWSRPDGTQLLGAPKRFNKSKSYWSALIGQTRRPKAMMAAMTLSGIGEGKRSEAASQISVSKLPALTQYCEPAAMHCGQTDWRRKGSKVALEFGQADCNLEALGPKGIPLLHGDWTLSVEIDSQARLQLNEWQEVCWFCDEDVDYLEIEARFGDEDRVQRQMILFREERLLLLADTLISETASALSMRSQIQLAANVSYRNEVKSTEGFVKSSAAECLALPLFLPEWKRDLSIAGDASSFSCVENQLVANAVAKGKRLYMPTLFSLCPSHARKPFTWRHLTVADELRIVRKDEAQAFRIQIGTDQWFVYRNLAKPIRRTALGVHTMDDFYAARFDSDEGECDTIVQVEATSKAR
ncbi:MAG: hypothetical protein AB8B50_05580 [Pirellulaceae bacterium]